MQLKGLCVNMGKSNIIASGPHLGALRYSGKYPSGFCRNGVARNSIYCHGCSYWVYKRCTNIRDNYTHIVHVSGTLAHLTANVMNMCQLKVIHQMFWTFLWGIPSLPMVAASLQQSQERGLYELNSGNCYLCCHAGPCLQQPGKESIVAVSGAR